LFKYITSLLILLVLISCSSENSFEDEKSSSLIKPNYSQIQARYDCALSKDTSLNRLEAFIPNFVIKVKDALPSASLEIFFNDQENINNFSLLYLDDDINFNSSVITTLLYEGGMDNIAECSLNDDAILSSNFYIDNKSIDLDSFEVEVLNCTFNNGFNFGTFAIEVDSFLNLIRKKGVTYFAKFQQANETSLNFTWINYLGSIEDKDILYKGWLEEEDSIKIQEAFNLHSTCESSIAYKGYKIL
tara:strand:- start:13936 stop:14670 length:735 start_codon:yes stop_codon:yes gene_type:complete